MPKDEWLHIRIDLDLKSQILQYAKDYGYEDVASLIREAIREKIDPARQEDIKEQIRQALQDDPSLIDDALRRIGIRLYATKPNDQ